MWTTLVRGLLPDDVAVVASEIGDATGELWPEEAAHVARAIPKRQREFARGRASARQALAELGVEGASLLVGSQREPVWPEGIVGSISHDDRLCVVAVARSDRYAGLGVDVEPDAPLEPAIAARVWSPAEAEQAARRSDMTPALASRLVFSAKEAFYKCQFPFTRTFLGFKQVSVTLGDGTFEVRLVGALAAFPAGTCFTGQWRRVECQKLTAVVLPRAR